MFLELFFSAMLIVFFLPALIITDKLDVCRGKDEISEKIGLLLQKSAPPSKKRPFDHYILRKNTLPEPINDTMLPF